MTARRGAGPQWPPDQIKALIASAHIPHAPLRDAGLVLGCGDREAREYIRRMLNQLAEANFYERFAFRNSQGRTEHFDVYCLRDTSDGDTLVWYVKLCVDSGTLIVKSFHEPLHPMK